MRTYLLSTIIALITTVTVSAQAVTATVVDAKSGEAIPFATVILGEHAGVITNEDGVFSITAEQREAIKDSIYISSMGYGKVGVWLDDLASDRIELSQKT